VAGLPHRGLCGCESGSRFIHHHPPRPHRLNDVLDRLFAQILVLQGQFILDLVVNRAREEHPAWVGQPLQPGGHIDPITVDLFAIDHHIAHVQADAKLHAAVRQQCGILGFQCVLDCHRALHGIDRARELGQHTVARRVHDAAAMLVNEGVGNLAVSMQGVHRRRLICAHEAAVAFDIGTQDRRQLTLDILGRHLSDPLYYAIGSRLNS
jgi:hypothetical protein